MDKQQGEMDTTNEVVTDVEASTDATDAMSTSGEEVGGDDEYASSDSDFEPQDSGEIADGNFQKKVLTRGKDYQKPDINSEVTISYVGTVQDGTGTEFERKDEFKFVVGKFNGPPGLERAVKGMRKGEKCEVTLEPELAYGKEGLPPLVPPNAKVQFQIELKSWIVEKKVTDDEKVVRKVLEEGSGWEKPKLFDSCKVVLTGTVEGKDQPFLQLSEPTSIILDHTIVPGLVEALQDMKKGGKTIVIVQPAYGYGKQGHAEYGIPANATLRYDLTLESFEKQKVQWDMSKEENIEHGTKMKDYANVLFRANLVALAKKYYEKVSTDVSSMKSDKNENEDSEKLDEQVKQLKVICSGNTAACLLKQKDFPGCIKKCNEVLTLDPNFVKCYIRRGQARTYLGEYRDSMIDFKKVLELEPSMEAQVRPFMKSCKAAIGKENQKLKQQFGGFFKKVRLAANEPIPVVKAKSDLSDDEMEEEEEVGHINLNESKIMDDTKPEAEDGDGAHKADIDTTGAAKMGDTKLHGP